MCSQRQLPPGTLTGLDCLAKLHKRLPHAGRPGAEGVNEWGAPFSPEDTGGACHTVVLQAKQEAKAPT